MNEEPDVTKYESLRIMYENFTEEERAQYWKRLNYSENQWYLESLHRNMVLNNLIIKDTKRWLENCVDECYGSGGHNDEDKLKAQLTLGAELIQNCEADTGRTRAEIAHVTRYPLYSEKRRQWYKSKEGSQWLKNQPKKR